MGHFFLTEATFSGIRMDNTQKMWKIGLHFETCRWKYVPFSAKMTLKSGKGVSKLKRYPLPPAKQIWVRCLVHFSINLFLLLFFVHLFLNPMQYTFILFIYLFIYLLIYLFFLPWQHTSLSLHSLAQLAVSMLSEKCYSIWMKTKFLKQNIKSE